MDLSTGKRIDLTREAMIAAATVPIGTVPIYQALEQVDADRGPDRRDPARDIDHQARQGVDYMTIHAGTLLDPPAALPPPRHRDRLPRRRRHRPWMLHHGRENPLYEAFDDIFDICPRYDVSISLGDGLRPGLARRRLRRRPVRRAARPWAS